MSRIERVNAIRCLSMDAVEAAKSGHPGAPMGMANIAEVLWHDFLKHNPNNAKWQNRDRFILSNGHASMLLYSLLHLSGYPLSIRDIKQFRQLHSKTPGHPEYGETVGVETTTGPLGQGLANGVGMAIAERTLAARFNKPSFPIVDHYTYVFLGDGCLMEGVSHEACSLAGVLKLGKLIAFYDDNGISIDGSVLPWFQDDTPKRFNSYGWHVIDKVDGHDSEAIQNAIHNAQQEKNRPTLICCQTIIGFGSPNKSGKSSCHGAALGVEEIQKTRDNLNWNHPPFDIPNHIYQEWDMSAKGKKLESQWLDLFDKYKDIYPNEAAEYQRQQEGALPKNWDNIISNFISKVSVESSSIASRQSSQLVLKNMYSLLPELIGGSADLTGSNLTHVDFIQGIYDEPDNQYIYYGVREFGMAAVINGICLHGGLKPFGGTFLMFSEYARNALRMAALMNIPSIFVFTHDSVGLGEDGPTHQPVEQLASLRLIPNMSVWRPCDTVETLVSWQLACESKNKPFSLIFSRQKLAHQQRSDIQIENIKRGGYILYESSVNVATPDIILIATGSEVDLAMQATKKTSFNIRVVSMPSVDFFEQQDSSYRESVITRGVPCISIEAGVTRGWERYTSSHDFCIGIDRFGASAPAEQVFSMLNLTVEAVIQKIHQVLSADK